mmetsp:Transcript_27288/g.56229  ORF Transcript_27288/g.56229 Transcript_27288/m.56229 type:complete len:212 (+) Transcript_27288:179-814(+)
MDIRNHIGSMETFQGLAEDSIEDAKKKTLVFKAIKLPTPEAKCQYLKDGGTKPNNNFFSMCINCDRGLLDLPPMNIQIKQHNEHKMNEHFKIVDALAEFKAGIRPDPHIGKDGKALSKAPPLATKQYIITCKCQNKKRESCIVKCFYNGKQFEIGQCACTFENYFQGAAYKKANKIITTKGDSEKQARDWTNNLAGVNLLGLGSSKIVWRK